MPLNDTMNSISWTNIAGKWSDTFLKIIIILCNLSLRNINNFTSKLHVLLFIADPCNFILLHHTISSISWANIVCKWSDAFYVSYLLLPHGMYVHNVLL